MEISSVNNPYDVQSVQSGSKTSARNIVGTSKNATQDVVTISDEARAAQAARQTSIEAAESAEEKSLTDDELYYLLDCVINGSDTIKRKPVLPENEPLLNSIKNAREQLKIKYPDFLELEAHGFRELSWMQSVIEEIGGFKVLNEDEILRGISLSKEIWDQLMDSAPGNVLNMDYDEAIRYTENMPLAKLPLTNVYLLYAKVKADSSLSFDEQYKFLNKLKEVYSTFTGSEFSQKEIAFELDSYADYVSKRQDDIDVNQAKDLLSSLQQ